MRQCSARENYKDNSLLGIGYDNKLYAKQSDSAGNINILGEWVIVPNNFDIIYVITDYSTKKLVAINIYGQMMIKKTTDLTSDYEPLGDLNSPILKLFYDSNGYMLALDTNFNLVQFKKKDWKQSQLNYAKGINKMKVFDILCFSGNKHMKRGQGLKSFPTEMLYKMSSRLDMVSYIGEMFKKRIRQPRMETDT